MSSKRSSFGDFLTGLVIGGAVGYVIALLYAPGPGEETRQRLSGKGGELRERARGTVQMTVDKTGKLISNSRDRLGVAVDKTRNRVQDRVSDLKSRGVTVTGIRSTVGDTLRRAAGQVDSNGPANEINSEDGLDI